MTQSFDAPAVVGPWRPGWLGLLMAGSLLALLASAAAPAINLNSSLALTAWAVSASGGFVGTPVVLVLGVAWLTFTGRFAGRRRSTALTLLAGLVGILAAQAWINERVVKPSFGTARPHIRELANLGVIRSVEEFYLMDTKKKRTEELGHLFNTEPAASRIPELHPLVRAHWLAKTGHAFPSGHTLATVTLATVFTVLGSRFGGRPSWMTWLFLPWSVLVGWSRHLLRVHSTSDICGGGLAGMILGLLAAWALLQWLERRPNETGR